MKALVLAEYYPRASDPVNGIWAHRQALAVRDAGVEQRVLVLHRPLPPLRALRALDAGAIRRVIAQPRTASLDGITVEHLRYLSPPRPWSYGSWGAWAAPVLKRELARIKREFPFELVHAHYAVPAGDAVRREAAPRTFDGRLDPRRRRPRQPRGTAKASQRDAGACTTSCSQTAPAPLGGAAGALGARTVRVVHLGADPVQDAIVRAARPTLVTVAHLDRAQAPRRRDRGTAGASRASSRDRYVVDRKTGPARCAARARAAPRGVRAGRSSAASSKHADAVASAQAGTLFVLPSVAEAFGGQLHRGDGRWRPRDRLRRGEDGPEEIAAAGGAHRARRAAQIRHGVATAIGSCCRQPRAARGGSVARHA